MIVYRLAIEKYKDDLTGTGAKIFGGRWNVVGLNVLYTTENISLSALEILVRAGKFLIPPDYMLLKIEVPDNLSFITISNNKLKKNWTEDIEYSQFIGSEFIKDNSAVALKVPSAIVDEENNYVINPNHPDFKKIKLKAVSRFKFDDRLFQIHE
ncbi:MAG: RES family NAD+ phosphorylase [Gloeobacteraceae cyanobacterium ES-bin-316]|nr:RES family NAD+ phosphorylase [Ferruginibacter sp.]